MGNYVHKPRKATFTVKKERGVRVFTPVNRRAMKMARKVGKRTRLGVADLRQFKGYHKMYAWENGVLKRIAF
jgi:hypothetical protein